MDINAAFAASRQNPIKMRPRQALQQTNTPSWSDKEPSTPQTDSTQQEPQAQLTVQEAKAQDPEVQGVEVQSVEVQDTQVQAPTQMAQPQEAQESETPVAPTDDVYADEALHDDIKPKVAKPDFTPVDISIAGTHHRIVCPADEVHHLETAVSYINDKMRSIRQEIKTKVPTNEELLVLTCLEMYDQIKQLQDSEDFYTNERDEALMVIDKLLKVTKIS